MVHSTAQGITQVVIGGAGYDGRAFRYARPGVRWFEATLPHYPMTLHRGGYPDGS